MCYIRTRTYKYKLSHYILLAISVKFQYTHGQSATLSRVNPWLRTTDLEQATSLQQAHSVGANHDYCLTSIISTVY